MPCLIAKGYDVWYMTIHTGKIGFVDAEFSPNFAGRGSHSIWGTCDWPIYPQIEPQKGWHEEERGSICDPSDFNFWSHILQVWKWGADGIHEVSQTISTVGALSSSKTKLKVPCALLEDHPPPKSEFLLPPGNVFVSQSSHQAENAWNEEVGQQRHCRDLVLPHGLRPRSWNQQKCSKQVTVNWNKNMENYETVMPLFEVPIKLSDRLCLPPCCWISMCIKSYHTILYYNI